MHAPAFAFVVPILALPYFQEALDPFGTQACGGSGCFTNYAALADIDGDGDLDAIFPNSDGYFSMGAEEPLVVLVNSAGGFTNASASAVGGFTGYLRQVALGDIDGDGDLDMYAPDAWGGPDAFFVNDGNGLFTDESATRLAASSRAGAARFGDVDGDGDLDLLVADWGADPFGAAAISEAQLYVNDGGGVFTEAGAQLPDVATPDGTTPIDIDFLDADGDFDLDVLLDSHEANERLWINDGAGTFTDVSDTFPNGGGLSYGPTTCDVDGDFDLDVAIDNAGGANQEQLFLNDGTGAFSDESTRLPSQNDDDNGVVCVDVDADGDLDLAIPSLGSNGERVLINDGTGNFTSLPGAFSAVIDGTLWMDFGDVNDDGRLDAITGQGESSTLDRLYLGTADQPLDDVDPIFRAVQVDGTVSPGTALTIRFAVQDSHVTDIGPRLQRAWLVTTIDAGAPVEVTADFVGGDLFQVSSAPVPATGAGSYHVCARDMAGNEACSTPELAFTIAPGGDDDDDDDDGGRSGGCSCRTTGRASSGPGAAAFVFGVMGVLLVGRSRRRV